MQVVKTQPTGAFTQGGAGIGAVIFDKPQYDPLTISMKMQSALERWGEKRQKEAELEKATTEKLVADLKFDQKGIYDRDEQYFIDGKDKLLDAQQKLLSMPKDSPEWKKAYYDTRNLQEKYKVEVEASKTQKEAIKAALDKFYTDPKKYNGKKFNEWLANVRVASTPMEREKALGVNPFEEPKVGLVEATNDLLKKGKESGYIAPQKVTREWGKTPEGERTMIEITELLPEQKRYELAKNWMADERVSNGVNEEFTKLPDVAKQYYIDKATQRSNKDGTVYSPQEEFYGSWLETYNIRNSQESGMGYSPMQQANADIYKSMKEEEREGAYLLTAIASAFNGDPNMLQPSKTRSGKDAVFVKGIDGKFSIGKTPEGNDNIILEVIRTENGKLHVMTANDLLAEKERTKTVDAEDNVAYDPSKFQDTRLYKTYDNVTQLWNSINKSEKIGAGGLRFADAKKARIGDGVSIDEKKLVGELTPEQKQKRDEVYGRKKEIVNVRATSAEQTLGGKVKTDGQQPKAETKGAAKKEIKKADIAAKAKAAGYSVAEYTKLLTDKGIKIID